MASGGRQACRRRQIAHRKCFALDLVDDADLIQAYEAHHAPGQVWDDVIAAIHASGVMSMEIWRSGDRLFMISTVDEDWPRPVPDQLRSSSQEWERLMDRFQKRLAHSAADEKWVPMHRIFSLD